MIILTIYEEVLETVMNREELNNVVKDAINDAELESAQIPAIDLYVDQILNLINERLQDGSERYYDRQLTKTMINNYSKEGLITPVKGKKYDKEQILQMLTIYTLKSTLSINEIKRLLQGMYATEGFDEDALTALYDRHLQIKESNREYACDTIDGIIERNSLDIADDLDYISLVCSIAAFSAHMKNIAQAMIDARFPIVTAEEPSGDDVVVDKREQKIERKKEKITAKGEAKVAKAEAKVAKVEAKVAKVEARTEEKMARVNSKSKTK